MHIIKYLLLYMSALTLVSGGTIKYNSQYPRNIKPFTNNDPSYGYAGASRRPRPIKHVRKGYASTYEPSQISVSDNGMPRLLETIQENPGGYASEVYPRENEGPLITELYMSGAPCCPGGNISQINTQNTDKTVYKQNNAQYLQSRCLTYNQNVYNFVAPKSIAGNTYIIK